MLVTIFSLHTALYLSLSFLFLFKLFFSPIMITFCRKNLHNFLSFTTSMDSSTTDQKYCQPLCPLAGGLGLVTNTAADGEIKLSPNVLESASLVKASPEMTKKDPGGIGFLDDIGGGVNGLMSCTESLGFESSDERSIDDEIEGDLSLFDRPWIKKEKVKRETGKFPPPLSSLNRNGQPSFFLRPVRKDGRLELTEVRIHRPEILRAFRENGRLILQLIRDEPEQDEEEEEQQEQEQEEDQVLEEEEEEEAIVEEEEEARVEDQWKFPMSTGEGFRRCHELINPHHHHSNHHHNLHVWRQHCLTIT
ncbi:hypothetical protein UlMin_029318 [Ulmus minor]